MATLSLPHGQNLFDDFVMVDPNECSINTSQPDYLDSISKYIEDISYELREISLSIHDTPELQYKEYHAHKVLTEYLKGQDGWKVTPSAYGIDTAFVASFDSGKSGPTVSFNAEYGEALRHATTAGEIGCSCANRRFDWYRPCMWYVFALQCFEVAPRMSDAKKIWTFQDIT